MKKNKDLIGKYVSEFNKNDTELYINHISNDEVLKWMEEEIPYFECPDKDIEKAYYFRWWTFRKHIKKTSDGFMVTEFLPNVSWSGKHNVINAPSGHHLSEGRWLKNAKTYLEDYIKFLLNKDGGANCHSYSSWFVQAICEYCDVCGDDGFLSENFDEILWYVKEWENTHKLPNHMFWSIDDRDAMEYSISGTDENHNMMKGIRPTLNSYMYANYISLAHIARKVGKYDICDEYTAKAEELKNKINSKLWDGFYKAYHYYDNCEDAFDRTEVPMEEIGFIPWMFNIPPKGRENVFDYLNDEKIFDAPVGITTADMRDKRFMYEASHMCLWSGYVWPFATSQTLKALINVINGYDCDKWRDTFIYHMKKYAQSHSRITSKGEKLMWIDEVLHPFRQEWTSRTYLMEANAEPLERGKDYNHSTFCDLVISGICGVSVTDGEVEVKPIVPDTWEYFILSDLYICGKKYNISYKKEEGIKIDKENFCGRIQK